MPQTLPSSAREYAAAQRQEIVRALGGVAFAWSSMTDDLDASWARIESEVLAVMDRAQRRIVAGAQRYIPDVLAETNPAALRQAPDYQFAAESIVGTAGDGLGTDTMAYEAVIHTKSAIKTGAPVALALDAGGKWLQTAVGTLLSDTGRTVEKIGASSRRSTLFVRMLNPPSCGRCIILAGKQTHTQTAFLRHPGCDCRNIPASESLANDLLVDPHEYLDSLDDKALARALGSKSNARAWQDGADPNQLINAYRHKGDVRKGQIYGRTIKYTTEGTTRRGLGYKAMKQAGYVVEMERKSGRYFRLKAPRLMPESIYEIAADPADAQRLLRLYGWIL